MDGRRELKIDRMKMGQSDRKDGPYPPADEKPVRGGQTMFPKSVSLTFACCAAIPVGFGLFALLLSIERRWFNAPVLPLFTVVGVGALSGGLIGLVLSFLGIEVRRRSVEQLHAVDRDAKGIFIDRPVQIRYNQRPIRIAAYFIYVFGLGIFLSSHWFLHSVPDIAPLAFVGLFFTLFGLFVGAYKQPKVCEINDQGIRAPGFWGWFTFVPWYELVRCDVVRNDSWGDYFLLWDRAGRCRLNASSWMANVSRADRVWILEILRSRFPDKAKADRNAEPALAQAASADVWDRQLDGLIDW
jgi:hypothetical protein